MRQELVTRTHALARAFGMSPARRRALRNLMSQLAIASDAELRVHGPKVSWVLETVLRDLPVGGRG